MHSIVKNEDLFLSLTCQFLGMTICSIINLSLKYFATLSVNQITTIGEHPAKINSQEENMQPKSVQRESIQLEIVSHNTLSLFTSDIKASCICYSKKR